MGTLVCLHAHPDDEAIATGGSMARAHAEGHRVVLVVGTNGEHGEVPGDLALGETLVDRRRAETERSAEVLGIDRIVWLGYRDSGMTGWDANGHAESFMRADVDEAAERLAEVLLEERADALTIYDWHGGYGHPDHIQVHRVGSRAAEMVRPELPGLRVFEATMNRDEARRDFDELRRSGLLPDAELDWNPDDPMDDGNPMGTPEAELTIVVDVAPYVLLKRQAIAAHGSQVTDSSFFLSMPDDMFARGFSREWFREHGAEPGAREGWLLDR